MLMIDYYQHTTFSCEISEQAIKSLCDYCIAYGSRIDAGWVGLVIKNTKQYSNRLRKLGIYGGTGNNDIHPAWLEYPRIDVTLEDLYELVDLVVLLGPTPGLETFYQMWAMKPGNLLFAGAYCD